MIHNNNDNAVRTRWSIALLLIALIGAAYMVRREGSDDQ